MTEITLSVEQEKVISLSVEEKIVSENNYEKLQNLPYLDGVLIVGNIPKPSYTAEEIGAMDESDLKEMDTDELEAYWNSI